MEHFQGQNVPSVVHWEPLTHLWEKGGNPISELQGASAQMVAVRRLFFDPQYADILEEALQHPNEVERLCVVETAKMYELFPVCKLSKDVLETWIVNWQKSVLGDFARFLLNAIGIKGTPDSNAIRRVRAAFRAFASEEDTLIEQMGQVNVQGKDPNWTYWHQLKCFFDYYTRDADAPMVWDNDALVFWVPPILHPSVKRLLLMAANFSERHLRRTFPNESIDIIRTEPAAWARATASFRFVPETIP